MVSAALILGSCATGGEKNVSRPQAAQAAAQEPAVQGIVLDAGIKSIADQLLVQIPKQKKVSFVEIEADTDKLSDYVIGELSKYLGIGGVTVIDRQNLAAVDAELFYEYSTGKVDDGKLRSMVSQDAPNYIIGGSVKPLGGQYNIALYAVDIESAHRNTATERVGTDAILKDLLNEDRSLDAAIERAVAKLGRNLPRRYSVKVGRISHLNTDSNTTFSSYLINGIGGSAASASNRFQIMGNNASTEAVIQGSFVPRTNEVEVWLRLVSAKDEFLSSSKFTVAVSELDKRGISAALPPNTTADDYRRKMEAISLYDWVDNQFNLRVTFDRDSALYHDGESMTFTVSADEDCYIKVTQVDVHGNQKTVYPISNRQNNLIKAGVPKHIPDVGRFRMMKPYGEEYVLIAAFREPTGYETQTEVPISKETVSASLKARGMAATDEDQEPVAATKLSYSIQE
jgi:hypothetical protein